MMGWDRSCDTVSVDDDDNYESSSKKQTDSEAVPANSKLSNSETIPTVVRIQIQINLKKRQINQFGGKNSNVNYCLYD